MSDQLAAGAVLGAATAQLRAAGIESPRREAELLLAAVLGVRREALITGASVIVPAAALARYRRDVNRRAGHEPLAYVTGHKEFMSLDIQVTPDVLVPRPETELLVEQAIALLRSLAGSRQRLQVADIGTGSGAIGLAIAHYCPDVDVWAVDISAAAVALARRNAEALGLGARVHVCQGDLLQVPDLPGSLRFDAIVANLPYVPRATIAKLAPEVATFEPRLALDGGEDGLDLIRRLVAQALPLLQPGGGLGLECDPAQCTLLARLLREQGYARIAVANDLAGRGRTVWGYQLG